ncbi:MAG: hypothetical protein WB662_10980, partial [Methyloceanibacter sp.]
PRRVARSPGLQHGVLLLRRNARVRVRAPARRSPAPDREPISSATALALRQSAARQGDAKTPEPKVIDVIIAEVHGLLPQAG